MWSRPVGHRSQDTLTALFCRPLVNKIEKQIKVDTVISFKDMKVNTNIYLFDIYLIPVFVQVWAMFC